LHHNFCVEQQFLFSVPVTQKQSRNLYSLIVKRKTPTNNNQQRTQFGSIVNQLALVEIILHKMISTPTEYLSVLLLTLSITVMIGIALSRAVRSSVW
jgi:hypothetical protein